jgi:hypothetical protein
MVSGVEFTSTNGIAKAAQLKGKLLPYICAITVQFNMH